MPIDTTLHVHKSIMETLNKSAEETGRAKTIIIKLLMQRVMNNSQKMIKSFSRIQYQGRDVKEKWHRLHIALNEYEYEYYLDMRKFYKMSVSYILAYAVRRYLREIINELIDKNFRTDNYLYKNYAFMKYTIDEIICWRIYWGIHPQILNKPPSAPY